MNEEKILKIHGEVLVLHADGDLEWQEAENGKAYDMWSAEEVERLTEFLLAGRKVCKGKCKCGE